MSRSARAGLLAVLLLGGHAAAAQDRPAAGPATAGPATADEVLSQARETYGPPPDTRPCTPEQDAAAISGEIVVCARRPSDEHRLRSADDAEARYAAATMDAGDPRAPDLEPKYPGAVVGRGCFIGPCPKPRAIVTDFSALPEAPPGSDADRIARGLAPTGDDGNSAQANARIAEELGLPPLATPAPVALPDNRSAEDP